MGKRNEEGLASGNKLLPLFVLRWKARPSRTLFLSLILRCLLQQVKAFCSSCFTVGPIPSHHWQNFLLGENILTEFRITGRGEKGAGRKTIFKLYSFVSAAEEALSWSFQIHKCYLVSFFRVYHHLQNKKPQLLPGWLSAWYMFSET